MQSSRFSRLFEDIDNLPPLIVWGPCGSGKSKFINHIVQVYNPDRVIEWAAPLTSKMTKPMLYDRIRFIFEEGNRPHPQKIVLLVKNGHYVKDIYQKQLAYHIKNLSNNIKVIIECMDIARIHEHTKSYCYTIKYLEPLDDAELNIDILNISNNNMHIYQAYNDMFMYYGEEVLKSLKSCQLVQIIGSVLDSVADGNIVDFIELVQNRIIMRGLTMEEICTGLINALRSRFNQSGGHWLSMVDEELHVKLIKYVAKSYMRYRKHPRQSKTTITNFFIKLRKVINKKGIRVYLLFLLFILKLCLKSVFLNIVS
jgi:hypothetical protein